VLSPDRAAADYGVTVAADGTARRSG